MKHLKILSVLNKLVAFLYALATLATSYFTYTAMQTGLIVAIIGFLVVTLLMAGICTLHWVLSNKLVVGQWKKAQVALAILALPSVPIGTIYGGYGLWVMLKSQEAIKAYQEQAKLMEEFDAF